MGNASICKCIIGGIYKTFMKLINGLKIAEELLKAIPKIDKQLLIIKANLDPSSDLYVKMKMKKAKEVGINTKLIEATSDDELERVITDANVNTNIGGILLQLPISSSFVKSQKYFIDIIAPSKDVDGLTSSNIGKLGLGSEKLIYPAVVKAILYSLAFVASDGVIDLNIHSEKLSGYLKGKKVLIINNSSMIGKPLALSLTSLFATVTIAHEFTENLDKYVGGSDIVITATGQPGFLKISKFKHDSVVIDVTSKKIDSGIKGDVDYEGSTGSYEGWITPVPGGIGPLTVACLLENFTEINS